MKKIYLVIIVLAAGLIGCSSYHYYKTIPAAEPHMQITELDREENTATVRIYSADYPLLAGLFFTLEFYDAEIDDWMKLEIEGRPAAFSLVGFNIDPMSYRDFPKDLSLFTYGLESGLHRISKNVDVLVFPESFGTSNNWADNNNWRPINFNHHPRLPLYAEFYIN